VVHNKQKNSIFTVLPAFVHTLVIGIKIKKKKLLLHLHEIALLLLLQHRFCQRLP